MTYIPGSTEKYKVEFTRLSYQSPKRWLYRIICFPFEILTRIYNTYLLIRYAELREPLSRNVCPMKWMTSFPSLLFSMKVTTAPTIMREILKHPRKSTEGLFNDKENAQVFLPLLKDLYPYENITVDDFLMTCNESFVRGYRQPILHYIGLQNIKMHSQELQTIVEETVAFWGKLASKGRINATELTLSFTTAVISRLFLGHPGPFEAYQKIAQAIDYLNKHVMKRAWKQTISKADIKNYNSAITIVRSAIDDSIKADKSFINCLQQQMSSNQVRSTLFLMFLGGSETAASLLNYLLWQLGRHPEYQIEMNQESKGQSGSLFDIASRLTTADNLFSEALRLYTPAYVIGRQPTADLQCTVKDRCGNIVFSENMPAQKTVLCAPTFAGRDPQAYERPDEFLPYRFDKPLKSYRWLPFGDGKHACPGQWLAKAEMMMFIVHLCKQYKIESFPMAEFRQKGYMTLKPAEDVWLKLTQR